MLAVFLVLEVVVGLLTSSLALLSDAGHMFTDVLGIGMALAATTAARRAGRDDRRTFGLYRAEVLAALANAVLLFAVAGWVLVEAVQRFADPPDVPGLPVMLAATAGLVANLVAFALLRDGAKESLNLRGAYLEVLADTLGSVGVLIAGAVTWAVRLALRGPDRGHRDRPVRAAAHLVAGPAGGAHPGPGRAGRRGRGRDPDRPGRRWTACWTCTTCTSGR